MILVAPNAQAMYISRRKPTMRDRRMVVTSKTVAENAVCSREGCRRRRKRRENEMGTAFWVSGEACIYGRFYMETLTFQPRLACHSRSPCRALLDRAGEGTRPYMASAGPTTLF